MESDECKLESWIKVVILIDVIIMLIMSSLILINLLEVRKVQRNIWLKSEENAEHTKRLQATVNELIETWELKK